MEKVEILIEYVALLKEHMKMIKEYYEAKIRADKAEALSYIKELREANMCFAAKVDDLEREKNGKKD